MSSIIALGTGGAATVTTMYLYVGIRGKGKINVDPDHVPYWAFGIGLLSANAGTAFKQFAGVGQQLSTSFQGNPALGQWETGATAALLTIAVFGLKPKAWKDAICGAIAPSLFAAAGGLWAIPASVVSGLITSVIS
ncbi:hypothetical protein [Kitasatospora purpeofusca]|uniref:hypothetical protein n=1 Tax=Kitasatospora purpeofusca TaxID=67352 RepID=UPI003863EEC6|nr:hypothetical protein OIP63_16160 [Kitasatospora purpeofusca]